MKSIVALTLLVCVLTFSSFGSVNSPTSKSVVYPGDKVMVTWDTNALSADKAVTILLNASVNIGLVWPLPGPQMSVAYNIPNTGSYEWVVPTFQTDITEYVIVVYSMESYGPRIQGDKFQVRFGHSRPAAPKMDIAQSVYLSWQATYGNTYEIDCSSDLTNWYSMGTIVADREDFGVTVLANGNSQFFRFIDLGQQ